VESEIVTFERLFRRLIEAVNLRIKNGEYTERGLARILGISQPQMHNVLKGARTLHVDLADRLLAKLGLSVLHLFEADELSEELRARLAGTGLSALKKPIQQEFHLRPHDRSRPKKNLSLG
jgi:transcriptional regulator with XRE-family HTH domain